MKASSHVELMLTQDFFPRFGGAHLWLYEIFRRWPRAVRCLTQDYSGDSAEAVLQNRFDARGHGSLSIVRRDIAVERIDLLDGVSRRRMLNVGRELQRLRDGAPATIYCLRAFPEGFCAVLAKFRSLRPTRIVVFAHGEEVLVARSSKQLTLMARLAYAAADLVIANSDNTVRLVKELCPSAAVVRIHPGVDFAAYQTDQQLAQAHRRSWGWPAESIVISTIARMERRKNHAAVLRAVASLRSQGIPVAYICGGDGEERHNLERLAADLGIAPWVRFIGAVSDAEKVLTYASSDIYAMPSIRVGEMIEGFGIVFLEAAAAGLPAVCGIIGGQPEAVLDGTTGLVVDGSNDEAVAGALRRLAGDAELRGRLASAARERAATYDWARLTGVVVEAVAAKVPFGQS